MRQSDLERTIGALRSATRRIEAELAASVATVETIKADSVAGKTGASRHDWKRVVTKREK
jgi:hypothetical protein